VATFSGVQSPKDDRATARESDPAFEKNMDKAEEIMARYRNTLHVLAK
jgi:hypothetical protein